mgnify:CR=1 FL=1
MLTYTYRCKNCNKEFIYQQKISDEPKTDCIVCKQPTLERLIVKSEFILKGGGWYKTDYGSQK